MDKKKQEFINELKSAGGIIYVACQNTGISRQTYYNWRRSDAAFGEAADEVVEAQIDYVEAKLMERINEGDTTATIFYLKTKGRKRGWNEKVKLEEEQPQPPQQPQIESWAKPVGPDALARIKNKKSYIMKLLKKEGKYTSELSMQVDIVAQLLVRTDMLREEILDPAHSPVNVETSREGNTRESISPRERLYLDLLQQSQRALRALGMNTDAKERKTDNDGFIDFMERFREGTE